MRYESATVLAAERAVEKVPTQTWCVRRSGFRPTLVPNWVDLHKRGYAVASCGRDGGRPTEIGRQRLISNHLMRLLLRAMVVSDEESQAMTWRGMD